MVYPNHNVFPFFFFLNPFLTSFSFFCVSNSDGLEPRSDGLQITIAIEESAKNFTVGILLNYDPDPRVLSDEVVTQKQFFLSKAPFLREEGGMGTCWICNLESRMNRYKVWFCFQVAKEVAGRRTLPHFGIVDLALTFWSEVIWPWMLMTPIDLSRYQQ